jgi:hypothetical protein
MENKSVSEYSFKRKNQAVTLQDKPTSVDIETGQISIDPQLLFVNAVCRYNESLE